MDNYPQFFFIYSRKGKIPVHFWEKVSCFFPIFQYLAKEKFPVKKCTFSSKSSIQRFKTQRQRLSASIIQPRVAIYSRLDKQEVITLPKTKCILTEQQGGGSGEGGLTLTKIVVTTPPTKTSYLAGDTFNPAGMVVTATYGIGSVTIAESPVTGYSVSPTTLVDGTTKVTITYSEMGQSVTTTQAVTVTHKLTKIAVTTNPTKMTYEYGDTLATAGMVVTATYSDNATKSVSATASPTALNTVGTQAITLTYSENGVTKTTSFNVTVNHKSVTKPTWKSNLTYNGSSQSVNSTSLWNNFNTTYMSISGTTSATNAGTYTATFTPGSNYRWTDGTTSAINVNWTINKAAGSLSLSATSVEINNSNLTRTVTVTRAGDGAISISPTSVTGLTTLSVSGNTITIKGNGSTAISSQTITVKVAEGTNHLAPANKTFTVEAVYFTWGTETATGDSSWWSSLKTWLTNSTASERSACVGKKKKMTLSSAFQGLPANTAFSVICIGADQDGSKTLTFQTEGVFPNTTAFSSSSALWNGSTMQSLCNTFAQNANCSSSMKNITKLTSSANNNSQTNSADVSTTAKAWIPSDCEMGFIAGADNSNGKGYASSYSEWTSGGSQTAYSYYNSNTRRIKYKMDTSGSLTTSANWYWERSRFYNTSSSNYVCFVSSTGTPIGTGYDYTGGDCAPAFVIG